MSPRKTDGRTIFVPIESFITSLDGVDVTFRRDVTRVREGHPILTRFPDKFREIVVDYEVEQATSAPGERR